RIKSASCHTIPPATFGAGLRRKPKHCHSEESSAANVRVQRSPPTSNRVFFIFILEDFVVSIGNARWPTYPALYCLPSLFNCWPDPVACSRRSQTLQFPRCNPIVPPHIAGARRLTHSGSN